MSTDSQPSLAAPTIKHLARTMLLSLAVAGALLVTVVLPAEYGLDPLGIGRRLGLTAIANPPTTAADLPVPAGGRLTPVVKGPVGLYGEGFKTDVFEVSLGPYEYVEYKYQLEPGASMLYSWRASSPVIQDLHGELTAPSPGQEPEDVFEKATRAESSGSFTAPFAGLHGWYWENPGATPVTIRLRSSGFYSSAIEIRSDRTRIPKTLTTEPR